MGAFCLLFLIAPLAHSQLSGQESSILIFSATLVLLLMTSAAWLFGPYRNGGSTKTLGFRAPMKGTFSLTWIILLGSLLLTATYTVIVSVTGLEALTPPPLPQEMIVESNIDRLMLFVLIILLTPLAEETFFRGFLLPAFVSRWGFLWGASLTSLTFSIAHGSLGIMIPAFVIGMLLAWLYYQTRSLWTCLLVHSIQNALALVSAFLT